MSGPGVTRYDYYNPLSAELGGFPRFSRVVTLLAGQVYAKDSVLGRITADGASKDKWTMSDPAAQDGTQKILGVLTEDVDATGGDVDVKVNITGVYDRSLLIFKANGWTPDSAALHLLDEGRGLFLEDVRHI